MFQGRSLHTYICTKGTDTDAHKNKEYKIAVRKTPSMACCGQYNIMGCQSINQSKRKTSNANGQTNLGHKHKAPDHNHEATQPMVDLPHTS